MADSGLVSDPDAQWLGIKLAYAVAGFWGGVVSLSFVKNLTPFQAVMAVVTGVVSASYGTPFAVQYLIAEPGSVKDYGVAYVIGLTAMNIIPGILKLTDIWRRNPLAFIKGRPDEPHND